MAYYDEQRPADPRDPAPVRRGGGWGAGWWIVFFVVIAFIIWAVAWSWNGERNVAGTPGATDQADQTAPFGNETASAPEVTVDQLRQSQAGGQWVNQNVRLTDVSVVARAGDQAFWVGNGANRILVIAGDTAMPQSDQLNQAAQDQQFQQGEELNITGTVHKLGSLNELQEQYGISTENSSGLNTGELYVVANQINRDQGGMGNFGNNDQNRNQNQDK